MDKQFRNKNMDEEFNSRVKIIDEIYNKKEKDIINAFNSGYPSYTYSVMNKRHYYDVNDPRNDKKLEEYIKQKCNSWKDKFGDNVKHTETVKREMLFSSKEEFECKINF
jgi:hypothetical protein